MHKFTCKKCKKDVCSNIPESVHTQICATCRDKRLGYSTTAKPTPQHAKRCKKCIQDKKERTLKVQS